MKKKPRQESRHRPGQARNPAPHKASGFRGGSFVIGRNTVREVLLAAPERFQKILITSRQGKDDKVVEEILNEARRNKIVVEPIESEALTALSHSDSHQGIGAWLKDRNYGGLKETLRELESSEKSLILVLDSILDPQNLGALLRAAECFAVDAVVFSSNRGVGLTASVSKASVGASELLKIIQVSNLVDVLRKLKEAQYWVIAADANMDASSLATFEFPPRSAIILGSEGKGLQTLLKKEADFSVFIPLFGKISSLNVSQAAAIFLSQYRLQVSVPTEGRTKNT